MAEQAPLFEIRNLKMHYPVTRGLFKRVYGYVKALDDVSLDIRTGETLGIVGESGCGKSTFGKALVRLEKPTSGQVLYRADDVQKDIATLGAKELFAMRKRVQMVYQDPYSALNPQKTILSAFEEPLRIHGYRDRAACRCEFLGFSYERPREWKLP